MNTERQGSEQNSPNTGRANIPGISLPKGGSIRGMGEKFNANPVTGTALMSIPIATSPGRSGFGPQLSLSYDSGAGNGAFGFGWTLSTPAISRKTDKGIPRYFDDIDIFLLSGAEDLIPELEKDGSGEWIKKQIPARTVAGNSYQIDTYRPRTEGLFARIERWTNKANPSDCFWRSISRDNITTWYGKTEESRVYDPSNPHHIFSWLTCQSHDTKGNVMEYRYKSEDSNRILENDAGTIESKVHERTRTAFTRSSQRYLKRICYGNIQPYYPVLSPGSGWPSPHNVNDPDASKAWHFEVVFDYGEHAVLTPQPTEVMVWPARPDPFSSYRPGFEVRTYRTCRRVLMFHHFPDRPGIGTGCLVRSTDLVYTTDQQPNDYRNPIYAFLKSVTSSGYQRNSSGGYEKRQTPPVEFTYSIPSLQETIEEVDHESLNNVPAGIDGSFFRWVDLHGEGIPGLLSEQAGAWFYKRNRSPIPHLDNTRKEIIKATFGPLERVSAQPNVSIAQGAELLDLAGDGQPDIVIMDGSTPGLYEHDLLEGWLPFKPFASPLVRSTQDPNLRFVDLDGDGKADVFVTEESVFVWHPSLGESGFGPARRLLQGHDEEKAPRVVFDDGTQSILLADFSGDGLSDIVRIRNGDICYWPNLGYGKFGTKITMGNAPVFDHPEFFSHRNIRLADIDGSGTTDIIYLHRDGVRIYFNQSGNSWSPPHQLKAFPRIDDNVNIQPVDLLGNGTACLVWSSPLPQDALKPMRYVKLMGNSKPHLLIKINNNLGVETKAEYATSTKFYLQDKRDGKPWITRLPFPVHVVERIETYDYVSRNRFTIRYAYHHGYFDGEEREFRGFGMVEQWDTEEITAVAQNNSPALNQAPSSNVPPIHTKTWYHTGVHIGRNHVSDYFAGLLHANDRGEYFREPGLTDAEARDLLLPDTVLPTGLSAREEREACRALKGSMLRQEVYADDSHPGSSPQELLRTATPYTVTEQNFTTRLLQPLGPNQHAVFFTHPVEAITYNYERNPADPRAQHSLTLEVDDYGNVLKQASVAYGRRTTIRAFDASGVIRMVANPGLATLDAQAIVKQTRNQITYTENRVTNAVSAEDSHFLPQGCESRTLELTGYTPSGPVDRFQPSDFVRPDAGHAYRKQHRFTNEVAYEEPPTNQECRRIIEWNRTLFRRDNLTSHLPLGNLEHQALPGESYKLAFTPGLLTQVFKRPRPGQPDEILLPNPILVLGGQTPSEGGYVQGADLKADGRFPATDVDNYWWIPSGRSFYHPKPVPPPVELAEARANFYATRRYVDTFGSETYVDFDPFNLLMVETRDSVDNRITVEINDYRVLQPTLISDPNRNQSQVVFDTLGLVVGTAVMGKPLLALTEGDNLTGFVADLSLTQLDNFFGSANRQTIALNLLQNATTRIVYDLDRFRRTRTTYPNDPSKWLPACAATIARETHVSDPLPPLRLQVSFSYSDGFGREIQKKIQAEAGPLVQGGPTITPRSVGSGWTIYNNKGKPVLQFEPFFSATHHFEFNAVHGVSSVLFYDPAGRVVATLHPNYTYEKVVFDPWQQTTYDVNDTSAPQHAQTGDPRTDPDIKGFVADYFKTQPATWQTWYAQRINGSLGPHERKAAASAAAHADTPTTAHLDVLGRSFLTIVRNRVVCPGHDLDGTEDSIATRVELDIEGNQRMVIDERKLPVNHLPSGALEQRTVMSYAYDMLGNRIYQFSMEAGTRWMLNDVAGKPIRAWDSRGHNFTTTYDALRRPLGQYVRGSTAESDSETMNSTNTAGLLVDRIEYGEPPPGATQAIQDRALRLNLRTRVYRHFDTAGVVINARLDVTGHPTEAFDFKGNLLRSTRQLTRFQSNSLLPDWSSNQQGQLEAERFETSSRFDALNRQIQSVAPHSTVGSGQYNVIQPVFNEANLLKGVDVWLERANEPIGLLNKVGEPPSLVGVDNIDYNAKGQRKRIDYKNGASTSYDYDPLTFRLALLRTTRRPTDFPGDDPRPQATGWPGSHVQNLRYTYDPAGNITCIQDDAQQTIYFKNKRVEPGNDYTYDALYRLISATGREHLSQGAPIPHSHNDAGRVNIISATAQGYFAPNDGNAMGTYVEQYVYDAVGNFLQMQHRGSYPSKPGWTRRYTYNEPSLIENTKVSNRLSSTQVGNGVSSPAEPYQHDAHGNMTQMPHLQAMDWDYRDQLRHIQRGTMDAYYVYDAAGQRIRKVVEKNNGALIEERIYLGGYEIFRTHSGTIGVGAPTLERETLHVMDDKQRIALVETRTLGSDLAPPQLIRYQFGNHLGSTSLELDVVARIISYEEYSPYGSSTYQAVRSQAETAKRYMYTGKERDDESGLYYHGARCYASWLARWVSADFGLSDGLNLYHYVRNSPIGLRDPQGQAAGPPPLMPAAPGLLGYVTRFSQQAAALYDAFGRRLTENEHVVPRGHLEALTTDPATGASDYTDTHYRADDTVRFERNAALDKTHGNRGGVTADNVVTKQLKATVKQRGSLNKNDVLMSAIENANRAAKKTGSSVPEGAINRAALGQDGNLFSMKTMSETAKKIGATADDVDNALQAFELGEPAPNMSSSTGQGVSKVAMEATSTEATTISKVALGSRITKVGGRIMQGLAVAGALAGGIQVGGGINKIIQGNAADGAIDVGEGSVNLGLSIGSALGIKAGVLTAEVGLGASTLTASAGLAAAGSVMLLAETLRASSKGEDTPIDVADQFYGTHFGDIYGWVKGDYSGNR